MVWQSTKAGGHGFWQAVTSPDGVAALELTLTVSAIVAVVNAVMGTAIAWMLVRDRFRGSSIVNGITLKLVTCQTQSFVSPLAM